MDERKPGFINAQFAYNKQIKANLDKVREDVKNASSTHEIIENFHTYSEDLNLTYKNKIFWILILITVMLFLGLFLMLSAIGSEQALYLLIVPIITIIIAFIIRKNDDERQELIKYIENQYLQKKYDFENHKSQKKITHNDMVSNYSHLFKKGNYSNNIPYYASGSFIHNQKTIPYTIFNYHFVDKRTEKYKENGKWKTRVIYDHYDNWGIFMSDINCISFSITDYKNKHFPIPWTTSSADFNKRHFISGGNEIELAKLMQPVNVLMFEKLLGTHASFELTSNDALPTLCWNFNRNILKRNYESASSCVTAKQFGGHLSGLSLPQFEVLLQDIKPLLEKLVK